MTGPAAIRQAAGNGYQAHRRLLGSLVAAAALLAALFAMRWYSYLLFHAAAELFAIAVASAIFMVVWHSRRFLDNNYLGLVGVSSLFVAITAALHMLAYKGMGVFPVLGSNLATQLWLVSRYILVTAFMVGPYLLDRRFDARKAAAAYAVITSLLLVSIATGVFPACFVEGVGLTPIKIAAEWGLIVALLVSIVLLVWKQDRFDKGVLRLLHASLATSAAAEVAFTLYTDPFGTTNLVGHFLLIVSFYMVYRALVRSALEDPYTLLFRELKQREEMAQYTGALSDGLNRMNAAINSTLDLDGIMHSVAEGAAKALGSDGVVISLRQDRGWVVRAVYGYPPDMVGTCFTRDEARHLSIATDGGEPVVVFDVEGDDRVHPALVARYGLKSLLTVPLMIKGEPTGTLSFHFWQGRPDIRTVEVDFARKLAASVSLALENARLYAGEHEIAETLQAALLSAAPSMPGIEAGVAYQMAPGVGRIGGDFYDIFETDDGRVAFIIGDVCGKGIGAAATTAMVKSTVRAIAYLDPDPAAVLRGANESLSRQLDDSQFVTALMGVVDVESGEVLVANAGHPDPYLCHRATQPPLSRSHNPPLGPFPGLSFAAEGFRLAPGETLVLFTDGVLEARRSGGFLGEHGVREVLSRTDGDSADAVARTLLQAAMVSSDGPIEDDIAIVALRYLGPEGRVSGRQDDASAQRSADRDVDD